MAIYVTEYEEIVFECDGENVNVTNKEIPSSSVDIPMQELLLFIADYARRQLVDV